jgi:heat shock protein HslJ
MPRTLARLLLVVALAFSAHGLFAGCRTSGGSDASGGIDALLGDWRVERLEGAPLGDVPGLREAPTLAVAPDGALSGFAGVNRFAGKSAPETLATGDFAPGPLAVTRMAGPPAAMDLETRYLALLGAARHWRVERGALVLADGERELVRLVRTP